MPLEIISQYITSLIRTNAVTKIPKAIETLYESKTPVEIIIKSFKKYQIPIHKLITKELIDRFSTIKRGLWLIEFTNAYRK